MLLGHRVEVRGVVRKIRPKEYLMGVDADRVEDPELPVLPAPDVRLPRVSLSFLSIFDATPSARSTGDAGVGVLHGLLADPEARRGSVRVVGQFRGANLFGDLPDLPGRDAGDFVLKDSDTAIWVIGKTAPRGPTGPPLGGRQPDLRFPSFGGAPMPPPHGARAPKGGSRKAA